MKFLIKKYWLLLFFAIVINIPIFIVGVTTTNQEIVLKGDTVPFTSVVEVDTDYEEKGSFSTIYVVAMYKSTILQNFSDNIVGAEGYDNTYRITQGAMYIGTLKTLAENYRDIQPFLSAIAHYSEEKTDTRTASSNITLTTIHSAKVKIHTLLFRDKPSI